jgi:hypothetical protein
MIRNCSLTILIQTLSFAGWTQPPAPDSIGGHTLTAPLAASFTAPLTASPTAPLTDPSTTASAGHPLPALIISGSADIYYRYDLARTDKNELTSFTRSNAQFQLGMASVRFEHKTNRVEMVAELGFGPREREYAYNDQGITQAIKQLYLSYSPYPWLKFTGGTWATHLGYEVVDAFANRNYSMSYLFTNGPFSHTGIRADLHSGKNGLMIGISNPCDYRSIPAGGHNNMDLIAQYSYAASDDLKLYLNYVGGRDIQDNRTHQYDLTITDKLSPLFSFGFNSSLNRSSLAAEKYSSSRSWWGSALYLNLDPKSWLGLTLRTEYFNDEQGERLPAPAAVFATTLSANLKVDGFTFIPEFRLDNANAPIFFYHNGAPARSAANFLLAAVYSF